jgi:hypothetical protein
MQAVELALNCPHEIQEKLMWPQSLPHVPTFGLFYAPQRWNAPANLRLTQQSQVLSFKS